MNFTLIFKYLSVLPAILSALEVAEVAIKAGEPISSPPVATYIEGKHGNIVVSWSPIA